MMGATGLNIAGLSTIANAPPPLFFAARGAPSSWDPRIEGGGAPTGAGCGSAAPRGPPRGRTDLGIARDHRPMTPTGAPLGAPPWRFLSSAPFFRDRTGSIPLALIPAAFAAVRPALVQPTY